MRVERVSYSSPPSALVSIAARQEVEQVVTCLRVWVSAKAQLLLCCCAASSSATLTDMFVLVVNTEMGQSWVVFRKKEAGKEEEEEKQENKLKPVGAQKGHGKTCTSLGDYTRDRDAHKLTDPNMMEREPVAFYGQLVDQLNYFPTRRAARTISVIRLDSTRRDKSLLTHLNRL